MEHAGLRTGQISQVRGFADRQLRVPSDPLDPSNRRISVIVHYLTQTSAAAEDSAKAGDAEDHQAATAAKQMKTAASAGSA
jgi:chemotaxis protein MotB